MNGFESLTGKQIELVTMGADDPNPLPAGSKGIVRGICPYPREGLIAINVEWAPEVGRSLTLMWPVDQFKVIC